MDPKAIMNSDISQFISKLTSLLENKSPIEIKEFLLHQILQLATKLSQIEADYDKVKLALEAKDDLIEEYQKVIKESTVKLSQLKDYNDRLVIDKQRHDSEDDALLMTLNDIRDEVEQIESAYQMKIDEKDKQISILNDQINSFVLEKNDLVQSVNDYHIVSEKEKEELNRKIDGLIKEIEYIKGRQINNNNNSNNKDKGYYHYTDNTNYNC